MLCFIFNRLWRSDATTGYGCYLTEADLFGARKKMDRVNQRKTTAQQQAEATGDFSTILIDSETILTDELGFRKGLWVELVDIYRDENADNTAIEEGFNTLQDAFTRRLKDNTLSIHYFDYIRTFDDLMI